MFDHANNIKTAKKMSIAEKAPNKLTHPEVEGSDSEDESPESVTFESSRTAALEAFKKAAVASQLQEQKLKEKKRRKRQKVDKIESRLEEIRRKALEEEDHEELQEVPIKEDNRLPGQPENLVTKFDDDDDDLEDEGMDVGSTQFKVNLLDPKKVKVHASEEVLDFRRAKLHGSRVLREPYSKYQRRQNKLKITGKNGFV